MKMAVIPASTPGRLSSANMFCLWCAASPGRDGSAFHTQIMHSTPITAAALKTLRQPIIPPRKLPSGAAITSAIETAPKITDSAFGTVRAGTRRMVSEADIAQKPPNPSPRQARPSSSRVKLSAKETSRQESVSSTLNRMTTLRRSMVPIAWVINRLANIATKAVTVTDCPATPSEMPRSCAIGVSRLTGRNSTVIRQATQNATEKTADQLGRDTSLACGGVVGWICSVMASPEIKTCGKVAQFIIKSVTDLTI